MKRTLISPGANCLRAACHDIDRHVAAATTMVVILRFDTMADYRHRSVVATHGNGRFNEPSAGSLASAAQRDHRLTVAGVQVRVSLEINGGPKPGFLRGRRDWNSDAEDVLPQRPVCMYAMPRRRHSRPQRIKRAGAIGPADSMAGLLRGDIDTRGIQCSSALMDDGSLHTNGCEGEVSHGERRCSTEFHWVHQWRQRWPACRK